jgi:hypothetical protein
MELVFKDHSRFQTHCSWRIMKSNSLVFGGGDIGDPVSQNAYIGLIGLEVTLASMSNLGDTKLTFDEDYAVEAIADTVQYESWDAHLDVGWIILSGGHITVFPSAPIGAMP